MEFRSIASSSAGCCYVLAAPGLPSLLIDCGVRYPLIQQALEFKVSQLAGCLISHSHQDHSRSVLGLLKSGVPCFASYATWRSLSLKGYFGCSQDHRDIHHRAITIESGQQYEIGPWQVLPFDAVHDEPVLGFLVGAEGERLLYLTDTAYSPVRFEGVTILAVEANWSEKMLRQNVGIGTISPQRFERTAENHMSLERVVRMLKANDLTTVREIHLLHLSDDNSDEAEFKDRVARATGKPVFIAAKQAVPC